MYVARTRGMKTAVDYGATCLSLGKGLKNV